MKDTSDEEEFYDFKEEELEAILDEIESTRFDSEDALVSWFEKKYDELRETRKRLNKVRPIDLKQKTSVYEILEPEPSLESRVKRQYWLDTEDEKKFHQNNLDRIGKYPRGFRQYETYVNYKSANKDASIGDYQQEMNRQVEFDEFLGIMRQAAIEESETPLWRFKNAKRMKYKAEDVVMSREF